MELEYRRIGLVVITLGLFFMMGMAPASPCRPIPVVACSLAKSWTTADLYLDSTTLHAEARGAASNAHAVFVTGFQSASGDYISDSQWIVRRSMDRGATWANVYLGPWDSTSASHGTGIATDPRSGTVYAVGSVRTGRGVFWTVQKSIDDGASWMVADTFMDAGHVSGAGSVAVAMDGAVYVAGTSSNWGPDPIADPLSHWIVRRSVDGGITWETVDNWALDVNTDSSGVAVTPSGRVFVSGRRNSPGSGVFVTRSSADGRTGWKVVDTFQLSSSGDSVALGAGAREDGSVFVAGFSTDATGLEHWIVRKASQVAPESWSTYDDYTGEGKSFAWAMGIGFARGGRVFMTGFRQQSPTFGSPSGFLTRSALAAPATFKVSDLLYPVSADGLTEGHAVTKDAEDDMFAVGSFGSTGTHSKWIVRRLHCE